MFAKGVYDFNVSSKCPENKLLSHCGHKFYSEVLGNIVQRYCRPVAGCGRGCCGS